MSYGDPPSYQPPSYPQPGYPASGYQPGYPQPGYQPPGYQAGLYAPAPPAFSPYTVPRTNGFAVAALITGICGFVFLASFAAIGLGVAGLSAAKHSGSGRGMAISGICLGTLWLLLDAALLLTLVAAYR